MVKDVFRKDFFNVVAKLSIVEGVSVFFSLYHAKNLSELSALICHN